MAEALVGMLALGVAVARLAARRRGITVRDMTEGERKAIAEPLGRIGGRHLDLDVGPTVVKDIADVALAAGGVTNYLERAARRHQIGEGRDDSGEAA